MRILTLEEMNQVAGGRGSRSHPKPKYSPKSKGPKGGCGSSSNNSSTSGAVTPPPPPPPPPHPNSD